MNAKTSRILFHGAVTVMYLYALIEYQKLPPMPHLKRHEQYAGRWKYLTYWNLVAHFFYFAFSFIVDFMKVTSSNYHKSSKILDKIYACIVMPYGMFVVSVFWILYSINRELIFPKVLDAIFPMWINHVSHTVILPVLLFETYILRHQHPRRKDGLKITAAFGIIYGAWILYLAVTRGIWPYPILYLLDWAQKVVFFGAALAYILFMYLIGEKINCCCWGNGILSKVK